MVSFLVLYSCAAVRCLCRLVLHIVVEREHGLLIVKELFGLDRLELAHDRGSVVVRHHMLGLDVHIVASAHDLPLGQPLKQNRIKVREGGKKYKKLAAV